MKRSTSGEQLWRDMRVSVIMPGQKDIVWKHHAEPKRGWTAANCEKMLENAVEYCERYFPSIEFRHVELAPNDHKFIYAGRKESMSEKLSLCPEAARSTAIAEKICAVNGHEINSFPAGMQITAQGPMPSTIQFCPKCGMTLTEIRDAVEQVVNQHIANEVNKRMAAVAAAAKVSAPAGAPGIELVPDATKPVESPS